jgi:hypothetical protein
MREKNGLPKPDFGWHRNKSLGLIRYGRYSTVIQSNSYIPPGFQMKFTYKPLRDL